MSDQAISMWHLDEMLDDMAEDKPVMDEGVSTALVSGEPVQDTVRSISELLVKYLYDPEMRLVFSGPGGLPYLVRKFARYGFVLLERTRVAAAG